MCHNVRFRRPALIVFHNPSLNLTGSSLLHMNPHSLKRVGPWALLQEYAGIMPPCGAMNTKAHFQVRIRCVSTPRALRLPKGSKNSYVWLLRSTIQNMESGELARSQGIVVNSLRSLAQRLGPKPTGVWGAPSPNDITQNSSLTQRQSRQSGGGHPKITSLPHSCFQK
jgi:hypothetical protein